jgi:hypothetical protein
MEPRQSGSSLFGLVIAWLPAILSNSVIVRRSQTSLVVKALRLAPATHALSTSQLAGWRTRVLGDERVGLESKPILLCFRQTGTLFGMDVSSPLGRGKYGLPLKGVNHASSLSLR